MVLESIFSPLKAESKPWDMLFLGIGFATIGIFLALWVFRTYASLIMVFLTVAAAIPFVVKIIKIEEKKDVIYNDEIKLIKEHSKAIAVFVFLFLGMVIAYTSWYVILPMDLTGDIFYSQIQTINSINSNVSAKYVHSFETFTNILFNNLRVLSFCILFSFMYGAGAIFILTWNASIIGAAIGNFIRLGAEKVSSSVGLSYATQYVGVVSQGMLRYMIHGIPEILAYFLGGLAGGIISFAIINHHYRSKKFENILFDTSELIILALFTLLIAAFVEVYVTPLLF